MSDESSNGGREKRPLLARLRMRTWRGRMAWLGGGLLVGLIVAWGLSRATPSWYQPLDRENQNVIDASQRAEALIHYDLRNTVERVPLGEQRWTITQEELNSYLAIDLAEALGGEAGSDGKPLPISKPCVVFTPGKVTVSARSSRIPGGGADGGVGSLVFSVGLVPGKGGEGTRGQVKLTGVWLGMLPVPRSVVKGRLQALSPAMAGAIKEAIELRIGSQHAVQWESVTDQIVRAVTEDETFPLRYRIDKKDLVIKELQVDTGVFTIVLVPAGGAAATAPVGAAQ